MSNQTPLRSRFGFSIRELLGLTFLIAISLNWPLLMYVVVPLILVAILSRFGFGSMAALVAMMVLSVVLGIGESVRYWRYPFVQPRLLAELNDIDVVEQLSKVNNLNPELGETTSIWAMGSVPPASALTWNTSTQIVATERILQELGQRKASIQFPYPLPANTVTSMWHAADEAGILIEGEPGYSDTKTLSGYVGRARLKDGTTILFATLSGLEQSNDHYPYYEFAIPIDGNEFTISNFQWFFEDIAGIEGFNWISFSVLLFAFVLAPAAIAFGILRGIWRIFIKRRQARLAAGDGGLGNVPAEGHAAGSSA